VLGDTTGLVVASDHEAAMFCKNSNGILRLSQSSMKCEPFTADSLNSTPLFGDDPDGMAMNAREGSHQRLAYLT